MFIVCFFIWIGCRLLVSSVVLPYFYSARLIIGFGNGEDKKGGHVADCFIFSILIVTTV